MSQPPEESLPEDESPRKDDAAFTPPPEGAAVGDPPDVPADLADDDARHSDLDTAEDRVTSPSFLGLLLVQFLGATNDNIFRWLVIGIGKQYVTPDNVRHVLMAGSVCFVLPYLVLAAPAGFLADRFSKRNVIVFFKALEILIMSLGVGAILMGNLYMLFVVVALMGAQSALFGPSKMGVIPELVRVGKISAANGVLGLITVGATVVGMGIGNVLSDATEPRGQDQWYLSAAVLIGVATLGWLASLMIKKLPPANPKRKPPLNPVAIAEQTWADLKILAKNRAIFRVALGIAFFWSLGALAQLNIDQFAFEGGASRQTQVIPLLIALVSGVGVGSVLAGIWSGGRVELGILPLGAFGIMVTAMLLFTVQGSLFDSATGMTALNITGSYLLTSLFLFCLGVSAGLFDIPLASYLQHRSPPHQRGSIMAASNLLTFSGMLFVFVMFTVLRVPYHEGSFANLHLPELAADQQQAVDTQVADFKAASEGEDKSPKIEDFIPTEPSTDATSEQMAKRKVLLANLLWVELNRRQDASETLSYDGYKERFEKDLDVLYNVYNQATGLPLLSAADIFLLCSALTVPVFIFIIWLIPGAFIRFVVWLASRTFYRINVVGVENLPERGGALLVANHISWLDGIVLQLISSRPVRMVVFGGNFNHPILKWMAGLYSTILLQPSPKALARALKSAREGLNNGDLICIFPEGGISRTGQIQAFRPGMMKILKGTDVPVVPIYIDELWGSIFSFQGGKFFWKWPRQFRQPITIYIGEPVPRPDDIHPVRQEVARLGAHAVEERTHRMELLPTRFIRQCKRRKFGSKVADSGGADLSGAQLLLKTLILRRLLNRHAIAPEEKFVGVLLPPTAAAIATNMALSVDRRVAVNLNYTLSAEVINHCIKTCGIKTVLTSRRFMDKLELEIDGEIVYLEDLKDKPTLSDKLAAATAVYVTPAGMLARSLKLHELDSDDVQTIIFTSGSTGTPKGVQLTFGNIATQIEAVNQVVHLTSEDVLVGILPLFHSFGYTITMGCVAGLDIKGIYHFDPRQSKIVGKLTHHHKGTILLATPTFLRPYLRRVPKEEFATIDVVVAGAEKLPVELCDAFEEKFGARPVEGYGATELSPLVSVNIPPSRSIDNFQKDLKEGSVGRCVPGVTAKVIHLETGEEQPAGEPGMLLIRGPNVMKGYLNELEKTAEVIRDGWYVTGDVAIVDDEGFITITGRESRFSKIGGEMVPHIKIEDCLTELIGADEDLGPQAAVTAVPDEQKGERLVVIHAPLEKTPDELRSGLREAGLPNLFIPSANCFFEVEELPVLGTGKLDLKAIRELALERSDEN